MSAGRPDDTGRAQLLERQGKLAEARDLLLSLADRVTGADRARLLARASELVLLVDGPARAADVAAEARALAEADVDVAARAHALTAVARIELRRHTDGALASADAALAGVDALDALPELLAATALKLRGLAAARRGRVREALELFAAAYDGAAGDPELRGRVLISWALQLRNWGLFAEAQRRAERALEVRLELGDHYGAALCYGVLAFIYQRQGDSARERDALVADLRECERIGGTADAPALHGRLAGALIGLGKYAGAWAEAERAIALEDARAPGESTRVHGYAWREQARVCLAQARLADGLALAERATALFDRAGDGYGGALCRLTWAELAAADGDADRARRALAAAAPVFTRVGALPEAAECVLLEVGLGGAPDVARIVDQVVPALRRAGLGDSPLCARALALAERLDPAAALERVVTRAAMLRGLATVALETDPQPATVVAARLPTATGARAFARAATDGGAVVSWPTSDIGLAIFFGHGNAARAAALVATTPGAASAAGVVDLEHPWPAPPRARGLAVDAALGAVTGDE